MDLRYTASEAAFRDELVEWLETAMPQVGPHPARTDWVGRRNWDTAWQAALFDAGYAGINWPQEYGGRGATPTEHLIFLEETTRRGAPYVGMNFVGLLHAGPTLITEASTEQKSRHLEPILRGDHIWCQGFSEPGAGSDLASLSTRAYRDGDEYVINGQKIWTSFAHVADYCELLVRTDPKTKHGGITWLIMPMDAPGIDLRPINTIAGSSEFCEMFLDDVRIPVANRVGDENDGWRVAMVTFSFERGTAFTSEQLSAMNQLAELTALAKATVTGDGRTAWDDDEIRREIGRLDAHFRALWALTKRNVSQAERTGVPGPGGSVFKLAFADAKKHMADLAHRLLGRTTLALEDGENPAGNEFVQLRLYSLSLGIAAGTSQIQRNIVGERILGLPKDR